MKKALYCLAALSLGGCSHAADVTFDAAKTAVFFVTLAVVVAVMVWEGAQ